MMKTGKALQTSAVTSFVHNPHFSVLDLECVTGRVRTSRGSDFHKTEFGCLTFNGRGVTCRDVKMPKKAAFDEAKCKCLLLSFEST